MEVGDFITRYAVLIVIGIGFVMLGTMRLVQEIRWRRKLGRVRDALELFAQAAELPSSRPIAGSWPWDGSDFDRIWSAPGAATGPGGSIP
jgi:hypothetical protein